MEEGYDAARHCGLNIIATLKKQLGDLDRVEQVIKVCASLINANLIAIIILIEINSQSFIMFSC